MIHTLQRCADADHKYEGRYDHKQPKVTTTFFQRGDPKKDKIYVRDVCVKCGHTIERIT